MFDPATLGLILLIALFVGLISGSYPSFYLSSFSPLEVLKSNVSPRRGKGLMRMVLVIFQFAIAGALITGTLVVSGQQRYIRNKDLGMNEKNVMIIPVRDTAFANNQLKAFKEEMLKNPAIKGVASSILVPPLMASKVVFQIEKDEGMVELATSFSIVDHEFIDVMGMEVIQGRNFERERASDITKAFIVNEEAVKAFGWGDNPLGKRIRFGTKPCYRGGTARRRGHRRGEGLPFQFDTQQDRAFHLRRYGESHHQFLRQDIGRKYPLHGRIHQQAPA